MVTDQYRKQQRIAMYRAVAADPEDLLPRLLLADWLDCPAESGQFHDPDRAEFIRTQIRLAEIGEPRPQVREYLRDVGGGEYVAECLYMPYDEETRNYEIKNRGQWPVGCRVDVRVLNVAGHKKKMANGLLVKKNEPTYAVLKRDQNSTRFPKREYKQLTRRQIKLFDAHAMEWLGSECPSLVEFLATPTSWESVADCVANYRRGFVERIRLPWHIWNSRWKQITDQSPVREVEFSTPPEPHQNGRGEVWFPGMPIYLASTLGLGLGEEITTALLKAKAYWPSIKFTQIQNPNRRHPRTVVSINGAVGEEVGGVEMSSVTANPMPMRSYRYRNLRDRREYGPITIELFWPHPRPETGVDYPVVVTTPDGSRLSFRGLVDSFQPLSGGMARIVIRNIEPPVFEPNLTWTT